MAQRAPSPCSGQRSTTRAMACCTNARCKWPSRKAYGAGSRSVSRAKARQASVMGRRAISIWKWHSSRMPFGVSMGVTSTSRCRWRRWEAALGAAVELPTPDGPVKMNVPTGSQTGRKLRLRGRGIPGCESGDLCVLLELVLPPAPDDKARDAYRAMARDLAFDPRLHFGANARTPLTSPSASGSRVITPLISMHLPRRAPWRSGGARLPGGGHRSCTVLCRSAATSCR